MFTDFRMGRSIDTSQLAALSITFEVV
jgi:hypothetical protein